MQTHFIAKAHNLSVGRIQKHPAKTAHARASKSDSQITQHASKAVRSAFLRIHPVGSRLYGIMYVVTVQCQHKRTVSYSAPSTDQ